VLGWPRRYKLAHAFLWGYSYKRLKLAQLLGRLGVFLTKCRYDWKRAQLIACGLPLMNGFALKRGPRQPRASQSLSVHIHRHVRRDEI
jgi:hypothetical protein